MRVLILPILLFAMPAAAQSDSAAPAAPTVLASKAAPSRDKMVCRTMQRTGSRLGGKRECMTVAQWDERAKNDREELDRMSRVAKPE
ncbi:hypothetical protein ACSBM8_11385 [Sphingomonas sp. ASY06-1R]|uniref:hypothetical protein n=1 Tax=Sphingomonas sp. ASY06-1R TaxID=3445771 RepID=UPI003FA31123